jgi:thiol-disulfide isomerase/thioredoxin
VRAKIRLAFLVGLFGLVALPARAAPAAPGTLHALLLNGGGSANENFASHRAHLEQAMALLTRAGIDREHIHVFASDGSDPGKDLAVASKTAPPDGLWLLDGTDLAGAFTPPLELVNTQLDGVTIAPATRKSLNEWFSTTGRKLKAGDTLFLFVTDHGNNPSTHRKDKPVPVDPMQSRISLWGEDLTVGQMKQLLEKLPRGVRTVALMSQCFSGGFAQLFRVPGTCGYFSSTADRPAYGCYPENLGANGVGHAFVFLRALARTGTTTAAHIETLSVDDTPDVPLRTSDVFLEELLDIHAEKTQRPKGESDETTLKQAMSHRAQWEQELRLLDRIANHTGLFSPRSFKEVDGGLYELEDILDELHDQMDSWDLTISDMARSNLETFFTAKPTWKAKLDKRKGPPPLPLAGAFFDEFLPHAESRPVQIGRIDTLHTRVDDVEGVSYRLNVRHAALLRMRTLLVRIAGQHLLRSQGKPADRDTFAALTKCETLDLNTRNNTALVEPTPLPPLQSDLDVVEALLPGYLGIQFGQVPGKVGSRLKLERGAAFVRGVMPDSPAKAAGLQAGDIVIGPPDSPFTEVNEVRAFTMLTPVGNNTALEILRDGKRGTVHITVGGFPKKWPAPPDPPRVSEKAPRLANLEAFRGANPADLMKGAHLLYYWATWCGPCKQALPELIDFSRETNTPVIAITDEDSEALEAFFKKFGNPFVKNVVRDELRGSFIAHAVSATPTFVLVDSAGLIAHRSAGYSPRRGLGLPGWTWKRLEK